MHSEANARYLIRHGVSVDDVQRITTLPLAKVELIAKQITREAECTLLIERRRTIKRIISGLKDEEVAARTNLSTEEVAQLKKRLETVRVMLAAGEKPKFVSQSLRIRLNVVLSIHKDLNL